MKIQAAGRAIATHFTLKAKQHRQTNMRGINRNSQLKINNHYHPRPQQHFISIPIFFITDNRPIKTPDN
jgi:hypothetical protein